MTEYCSTLHLEVPEICRSRLPLNLTIFGLRGTSGPASWTSSKYILPFRTESNRFSIVPEKNKRKVILSRALNGISRCIFLCSKFQTTVMFCDQIRERYGKINESMNGPPFMHVRMFTIIYMLLAQVNLCYRMNLQHLCKLCTEFAVLLLQRMSLTL